MPNPREELEAALANWKHAEKNWTNRVIEDAARMQLALMPEKCEHGKDQPHWDYQATDRSRYECPGKVYPQETVETIARIIAEIGQYDEKAILILDALGEA